MFQDCELVLSRLRDAVFTFHQRLELVDPLLETGAELRVDRGGHRLQHGERPAEWKQDQLQITR